MHRYVIFARDGQCTLNATSQLDIFGNVYEVSLSGYMSLINMSPTNMYRDIIISFMF